MFFTTHSEASCLHPVVPVVYTNEKVIQYLFTQMD